jgi:putative FmdB family regulatory protein
MPLYEYRCTTCDTTFELRRPAAQSQAPAVCAEGHVARRVLSVFATAGHAGSSAGSTESLGSSGDFAGGCGPGCACAAGH